ncbi:filamentous hemagglutinin N-terminal domain-containing protein [Salmonella enterica]|nr:filamentous hemagglutinin N-terminal domain-containing protein [Salmonella enterica]ELH4551514.1 filamentous hemagglutinin N-terminal domain-containing protein [Salmonella enterica]
MNRIYKLKFDRRRNELVIVSEITAGAGKEKSTGHIADLTALSPFRKLLGTLTPVALLTGLIAGLLPAMVLAADLPTGGQIVGGQGSISTSGNQMTIHQQTQNMATNWHSFDIGKNNTVQFVQPDSSSVALNRVTGASGSQIMGNLKANGQVFILNPNGVLFGKDARVNVGGLVASTKNLSTADFMKGQYTLSGSGNPGAQVVNQGSLTTAKGGYIVLAGERVSNSGTVTTPGGKTVLAAGKTVTLQLDNGGLTSVSVNGSVVNALVENRGLISATNGQVYLTAKGQDMLLNTVVNNSGTVEAKGLASRGGEIVLNGGDSGVVSQSGHLLADSQSGQGGKITLEGQNIHLAGGSLTSATGNTGGGEVYVGGGWQGQDSHIKNASKVVMDKTATVDVSATENGNGGTAVLWSDDYTNFRGTVLAKGGAQSGHGGRVETSSHRNLQASGEVDASARAGQGGEWLLDPTDVTIVGAGADTGIDSATADGTGIFTPTATGAQILSTSIESQLNAGTSVAVRTSGADAAGQSGNITLNANITKTAGGDAALTLAADGNITLSGKNITSANGKLDITLLGAGSNTGMVKADNSTLNSNGGNITVDQLNHTSTGTDGNTVTNPNAMTIKVSGSTLNATSTDSSAASGDIILRAYNPNVNLSQAAYNTTVRNSGAILQIGDTSHLSGRDVIVEGTQAGNNAKSLPIFISGATLTAERDITMRGVALNGATPAQLELRGAGNTLTATQGNITMENAAGCASLNGVFLNGVSAGKVQLTALNGTINLSGAAINSGKGVNVTNAVLNASKACITGNNGFSITSSTLEGALADLSNVSLSSAGSAAGVTNTLDSSIVTAANRDNLLAKKIENMMTVDMGGQAIFDDSTKTDKGWKHDYTSADTPNGGWIFNNTTVNAGGDVNLKGASFTNSTLTVTGGNLSLDNGGSAPLTGSTITVNGGGVSVHTGEGNLDLSQGGVTASGDIALTSDNGSVILSGGVDKMQVSTSGGNLTIKAGGAEVGSVLITNVSTNISGNIDINADKSLNLTGVAVSKTSPGATKMTLVSGGDMTLNGSVVSTSDKLDLDMLAGGSTNNGRITLGSFINISLNGGEYHAGAADAASKASMIFSNNGKILAGNISMDLASGLSGYAYSLFADNNLTINGLVQAATGWGVATQFIAGDKLTITSPTSINLTANDTANGGGRIILRGDKGVSLSTVDGAINLQAASGSTNSVNITATDGNITINGKGNIDLKNGNISAKGDISLKAGGGSVIIAGTNAAAKANITSAEGNISIIGNGGASVGVNFINVVLSSVNMDIHGTTTGGGSNSYAIYGGVRFSGGVELHAKGKGNLEGDVYSKNEFNRSSGISFGSLWGEATNVLFDGQYEITGRGIADPNIKYNPIPDGVNGVYYSGVVGLTFSNDSVFSAVGVNGATGVRGSYSAYTPAIREHFILSSGANLTMNVQSDKGITLSTVDKYDTSTFTVGYDFSGDGNVRLNVKGNSTRSAVHTNSLSNNNLTGSFSINAVNDGGDAIFFPGYNTINLVNASIEGSSRSGAGIKIEPNSKSSLNLGNNVIKGVSDSGDGVIVTGNNVIITNGMLTGEASSGNGSGVVFTGGSNYTLDGASVTGTSADGAGVAVNGTLTVNNGTAVEGHSTGSGSGVLVSGNLATDSGDGISITGTALSGDGIKVDGDTTLTSATLNGTADSGAGVNIAGNLTTDSATLVSGHAASGTGVSLGAALTGASVKGSSDTGTGLQLADNAVVTEAVLNGSSTTGDGVAVTGRITLDDTTAAALNASSTSGTGLKLADNANVSIQTITQVTQEKKGADGNPVLDADGNPETETVTTQSPVTRPVTLTGTSEHGTGIATEGNVSISGIVLNGSTTADTGTGVSLGGNLTIADDISGVTAGATGNGTALVVNNASIHSDGYTDSGKGFVINASVSGNGTAIKTQGSSQLDEVILNGEATGGGAAVELGGQVSGANITGTSDSGTAVRVTDGANVDGSAVKGRSDSGTGLQVSGNASLNNSGLSGTTQTGTGAVVTGSLTADKSSQVTGSATQDGGTGVTVDGTVTGATVTGDATSGDAVRIADGSQLTGADIKGTSVTGTGIKTQGNVTLEGGTQLAGGSEQGAALDVSGTLNHDPDSSVTTTPDNTGSVTGNENIHEVIPVVPPVPEEGGNSQPDHLPDGSVDKPVVDHPSVPSEPVHDHDHDYDHSQSHDTSLIRQAEVSSQRRGAVNAQVTQRSQPTRGGFQSAGTPPVPVGGYTPAPQPVDISLCDGNDCQSESLDAGKPAKGKVASSGR